MPDFAPWLRNSSEPIPSSAELRAFAQAQSAAWPYHSNDVEDYVALVETVSPANAAALKQCLYRSFLRWRVQSGVSHVTGLKLGSIALVAAGLIIGVASIVSIRNPQFIELLAGERQARGLVTFLFAFATSSVIIVVTLGVLWVPKDEVEARFSKAKDILTILISVLGTILGFYFGSANTQPSSSPAPTAVSNTSLQPNTPATLLPPK